jgi:hypothetical protein
MTSFERAIDKIADAFRDTPRPPDEELLHEDCADDMDLVPLYGISHWEDMTDEDVIGTYAAPSFLSPAGFRHFLPAYMTFALRNPDSAEACVSSTIWHLDPSIYDGKLSRFARTKFALLNDSQKGAVREFLRAMRDSSYGDDAARALGEWT